MCGIAGKIYFNDKEILKNDILKMTQKIAYRGPDDEGIYICPDKKVGLGHRRLSIIDLSPLGHQPLNYLNRYWIVFNGEIYNFQEKKEMLQKEGYRFKSKTDTEVIMALYDRFGKECLKHLRGMFSFAIYDEKEKILFCARDRIGKKPFKYFFKNGVFIFASELKAILTQKEYDKDLDYLSIHNYLSFGYCPAPLTGFKNIKKLEPAHYIYIDLSKKKIEKDRYWKLDYSKKLDLSQREWGNRIIDKLEESVKIRMASDVSLGAFLSGGIDSSAIVGLMSKFSLEPIKTFSIGFQEKKYNELPYARLIAKKYKTDHTEFIVKPENIEILDFLVGQYEEPFADSSALPTYYLNKIARKFITVALSGDGGDENFAGYEKYSLFKFSLLCEKLSLPIKFINIDRKKYSNKLKINSFLKRVNNFSHSLQKDEGGRYIDYSTLLFRKHEKINLYNNKFKNKVIFSKDIPIYNFFCNQNIEDKIDKILHADINFYLADDLMTKIDISSMAVSLEVRSPLLDHEFVELTSQIPSNLKLRGLFDKKYIFKKSLEDIIPKRILHRRKRGFSLPIDIWLNGNWKKYAFSKITNKNSFIRDFLNEEAVLETLLQGNSHQIWGLLVLEIWLRKYFE